MIMKNKVYIQYAITIIMLLLWIPVSVDKLIHFGTFRSGILRQPFSDELGYILIYSLPGLEIGIVILLLSNKYRWIGFGLSSILMAAFTAYIALALMGTWEKKPCGCGSVIAGLSWSQHLWFNLFFLAISIIGYILSTKWRNYNSQTNDIIGNNKNII